MSYLFIYLFFTKNPPNTNSCFPRNNNHSKIGQTHGQLTPNTKPHSNPPKIMKRRQCSCPKPIHCGLKSFLGYTLTLVSIHLHTCWPSIFIMDVFKLKQEFIQTELVVDSRCVFIFNFERSERILFLVSR